MTAENYFTTNGGRKIQIKQCTSQSVNNLGLRAQHLSKQQQESLENIVKQHGLLFFRFWWKINIYHHGERGDPNYKDEKSDLQNVDICNPWKKEER